MYLDAKHVASSMQTYKQCWTFMEEKGLCLSSICYLLSLLFSAYSPFSVTLSPFVSCVCVCVRLVLLSDGTDALL